MPYCHRKNGIHIRYEFHFVLIKQNWMFLTLWILTCVWILIKIDVVEVTATFKSAQNFKLPRYIMQKWYFVWCECILNVLNLNGIQQYMFLLKCFYFNLDNGFGRQQRLLWMRAPWSLGEELSQFQWFTWWTRPQRAGTGQGYRMLFIPCLISNVTVHKFVD